MEGIFADPRLGVFGYLSLNCHHFCGVGNRKKSMPRDGLDLRDFARVQQCIRGTTKGSPDIEGDDELSRKAGITGAGCFHDGGQRRTIDEFLGTRHTFPLHNGTRPTYKPVTQRG